MTEYNTKYNNREKSAFLFSFAKNMFNGWQFCRSKMEFPEFSIDRLIRISRSSREEVQVEKKNVHGKVMPSANLYATPALLPVSHCIESELEDVLYLGRHL